MTPILISVSDNAGLSWLDSGLIEIGLQPEATDDASQNWLDLGIDYRGFEYYPSDSTNWSDSTVLTAPVLLKGADSFSVICFAGSDELSVFSSVDSNRIEVIPLLAGDETQTLRVLEAQRVSLAAVVNADGSTTITLLDATDVRTIG